MSACVCACAPEFSCLLHVQLRLGRLAATCAVSAAVIGRLVGNAVAVSEKLERAVRGRGGGSGDPTVVDAHAKVARYFFMNLSKVVGERPGDVLAALAPHLPAIAALRCLAAEPGLFPGVGAGPCLPPALLVLRTAIVIALDNTILR